MNFKQVEAFRAVMLTGSMTTAAAQLHTSQPNVSRLISQLERETGLALFKRMGVRIVPTPEAEALLREVERAFVGLHTLSEAAHSIRRLGTGALRIGAVPSLAMGVLPRAIQAFRQRRPQAAIAVQTSDSPTVAKWTATGFCDFGLVSYLIDTPGVDAQVWHRERGVCIVPAGHRLAGKRRLRAADLDDEPFISLPQGDGTRRIVDAAFQPHDRRSLLLETPYAATICTMVGMGLGVSVVNPLVSRNFRSTGVREIAFEPEIEFVAYTLQAQQRVQQALVSEFLACLDTTTQAE